MARRLEAGYAAGDRERLDLAEAVSASNAAGGDIGLMQSEEAAAWAAESLSSLKVKHLFQQI